MINRMGNFASKDDLTNLSSQIASNYQPKGEYTNASDLQKYANVSDLQKYQPVGNYIIPSDLPNYLKELKVVKGDPGIQGAPGKDAQLPFTVNNGNIVIPQGKNLQIGNFCLVDNYGSLWIRNCKDNTDIASLYGGWDTGSDRMRIYRNGSNNVGASSSGRNAYYYINKELTAGKTGF